MRIEQTNDGNLRIVTQGHERKLLRRAKRCRVFDSDAFMYDLLDDLVTNSEYSWCRPEEIAALTTAPILCTRDESGMVTGAWGFMDYQVRSVQQDLLEQGEAIFQKG